MRIWVNCFAALVALGIGHMTPLPPIEYGGEVQKEVKITFRNPVAVHLKCGGKIVQLFQGYQILACAEVNGDQAVLPDPCAHTDESYARLLCHELGHIKGWPVDHPKPVN